MSHNKADSENTQLPSNVIVFGERIKKVAKDPGVSFFEENMKRNGEQKRKLVKNRLKANESVLRSYKIKK